MIGLKRRLKMREEWTDWVERKIALAQTPAGIITIIVGFSVGVIIGRAILSVA